MDPREIPPQHWDTEGQRGLASRPAMIDETIKRGQALAEELARNMNTAVTDRIWEPPSTAVANGPLFFEEDHVAAVGGTERSVRQVLCCQHCGRKLDHLERHIRSGQCTGRL